MSLQHVTGLYLRTQTTPGSLSRGTHTGELGLLQPLRPLGCPIGPGASPFTLWFNQMSWILVPLCTEESQLTHFSTLSTFSSARRQPGSLPSRQRGQENKKQPSHPVTSNSLFPSAKCLERVTSTPYFLSLPSPPCPFSSASCRLLRMRAPASATVTCLWPNPVNIRSTTTVLLTFVNKTIG